MEIIGDFKVRLHFASSYKMPSMHQHDRFEIGIVERGTRSFLINDSLLKFRPREVRLIKPNEPHCSVSGSYVETLFEFSENYLDNFFSKYTIAVLTKCFEKKIIRVRESDFEKLMQHFESLEENNNDVAALINIFFLLERNMERKIHVPESSSDKIEGIINYIANNFKTIENLDDLSASFFISKEYLCRVFKERTGTSIMKYISMMKVQAAINLIHQKELTMSQIAEMSGFNNLSSFSKAFKSITGLSPKEYRTAKNHPAEK